MTSGDLRKSLAQCGLPQVGFARLLGVTPRAVSMWLGGERDIPGPAKAYVRLFQLLPENLRKVELARLKDGGTDMRDGIFGITFQGQLGSGTGMLVFDSGTVYGADTEGARYDGSYVYREESERVDVVLKVSFRPNVMTVLGITNPYEWAIDVSAAFNPKQDSGPVAVTTSLGNTINAQFRYLRPLPTTA